MNRPEITPCTGCEMKSGCIRDHRCYRPRTSTTTGREWQEAVLAFVAATERVNAAGKAHLEALEREEK